ncbi:hypothetical protein EDD86DRAFT_208405 [Gorgonomyces haynaldii]|nr:hypothetical protein EDD86DRAFT_208405 [Gorgonomyces haynaldii]
MLFVRALFVEEINKYDWHKPLIGRPQKMEPVVINGQYEWFLSSQNTIATVDAQGSLNWRQHIGGDSYVFGQVVVVVGETVQAFSADNGRSLWEIPTTGKCFQTESDLFIATGKELLRVDPFAGAVVFRKDLVSQKVDLIKTHDHILVGDYEKGVTVHTFAHNGELKSKQTFNQQSDDCFFTESDQPLFVCSGAEKSFYTDLKHAFKPVQHDGLDYSLVPLSAKHRELVLAKREKKAHLAKLQSNGLVLVNPVSHLDKYSCVATASYGGSTIVSVLNTLYQQGKLMNEIFTDDQVQVEAYDFEFDKYGLVEECAVRMTSDTLRLAVVTMDDAVHLIRNQKLQWTREEGLAKIKKVVALDLPTADMDIHHDELGEDPDQQMDHVLDRLTHRWTKHYDQLRHLLEPKNTTVQEQQKIIVAVTEKGKVYGLNAQNGKIAWTYLIPRLEPLNLLVLREAHVKSPPVVAVVGHFPDQTFVRMINALDGGEYTINGHSTTVYNGHIVSSHSVDMLVPGHLLKHIALVHTDNYVSVNPSLDASDEAFKKQDHRYFLGSDSVIRGFKSGQIINSRFEPILKWTMEFKNQKILKIVSPPRNQVASLGRVLGDRNVLYKYLNPNVAAVASKGADFLYISLVETLSGQLLYRTKHKITERTNVELAFTENIVVYSFWNDKLDLPETKRLAPPVSKHTQVVVMELFESEKPNERMASYETDNHKIHVMSQSYVAPNQINVLSFTQTLQGITAKSVIAHIAGNHIVSIPRHVLDPKRPIHPPNAYEKEEQLQQYKPLLPWNPKEIVSYFKDISGINQIVSVPTFLESTSLVICYGHDLFVSQVMPSNAFDTLSSDFSYTGLIATFVGLIVGIVFFKYQADKKQIKDQWQ